MPKALKEWPAFHSLKKTIEPVKETPKSSNEPIKAFKIPKVKKIDKPEATPSKTVEADTPPKDNANTMTRPRIYNRLA